jgi:hypothetical protein
MPQANGLTDAERASLLRAARHRIEQMERELEIYAERITRHVPGAQTAHDIVEAELTLLSNAVRKIWTGANGHATQKSP